MDQSLLPLSEAPWIKWVVVCNRPLRFYSFVGEVLETLHKEKASGLFNCSWLKPLKLIPGRGEFRDYLKTFSP